MSLYKKFQKRIEDEMNHHSDAHAHDIIGVWGTFMKMMGEANFNKMLSCYMKPEPGHWENSEDAFQGFHKGLRQGDIFSCFVRTKEVPVPDVEGKKKGRTRAVIDEHIDGHIESLIWTMIHLDQNDSFQKTFRLYWDLHQQEVPIVDFVFERKSDKDWDDNFNGLVGVRIEGQEEFLSKKQFDELFPKLDTISLKIEHGIKKYKWNTGQEVKPKDATNYAAFDYPLYEGSRDIGDIISWESTTNTPFKIHSNYCSP